MVDMHYGAIWEAVADTVPDAPAVVQGARRLSWGEYEQRAARLAACLQDAGLAPHARVGMYLYNAPEYCETNFAAMKMRGVPININYRYLDQELAYLLDNADIEVLVFHSSLADRVLRVRDKATRVRRWIEVDDGPTAQGRVSVPGALSYDEVQARFAPAPRIKPQGDELYMLYTGGTTGMPKGVTYSMTEFTRFFLASYPTMLGGPPWNSAEEVLDSVRARAASGTPLVAMSSPPLMHGTGCWLGMMAPHLMGGTTVMLEGRGLDPIELWDTVARERVQQLIIVGDAFARPMLRELQAAPTRWDLDCLKVIISSGAMWSLEVKRGLLDLLPQVALADLLGSTEGGMGQSLMTRDTPPAETAKFMLRPTSRVFTSDDREVQPGSGEVGLVANGGLVPLYYHKDPEKSARTFRTVNGQRYSFPGDMASVEADGTLTLLGRGSNCINTGGEKVFPEEVEEALKQHPAVEDALVFGEADERFGQRVVGVASLKPGASASAEDILADAHGRLAGYKLPRRLVLVPRTPRAPNGKADYASAKQLFTAGG
ncbi:MAG: AMP-binding protein [Gammaproteobacteria bacterium]